MADRKRNHRGTSYPVSPAHPAAEVFPWMGEGDLQALADDIAANGQHECITRVGGLVVDGRNRELACLVAGVEPRYADERLTEEEVVDRVVSANLRRRDMTPSQRAMAAAELASLRPGRPQGNQGDDTVIVTQVTISSGVTQGEAAEHFGVSRGSVNRAARVKQDAPELVEAVKDGKIDVKTAADVAKLPSAKRKRVAKAKDPKGEAKKQLASKPADDPFAKPGREAKPDDPAPDPRFMPNADAAAIVAEQFRNWKSRLVALRTDFRKAFPDRNSVMARRIDFGELDASITNLIDTIDRNLPEHVCPQCCGTGDDGGECRFCDGYGIIDRHHHDGLKARWKRTSSRLSELVSAAESGDR